MVPPMSIVPAVMVLVTARITVDDGGCGSGRDVMASPIRKVPPLPPRVRSAVNTARPLMSSVAVLTELVPVPPPIWIVPLRCGDLQSASAGNRRRGGRDQVRDGGAVADRDVAVDRENLARADRDGVDVDGAVRAHGQTRDGLAEGAEIERAEVSVSEDVSHRQRRADGKRIRGDDGERFPPRIDGRAGIEVVAAARPA